MKINFDILTANSSHSHKNGFKKTFAAKNGFAEVLAKGLSEYSGEKVSQSYLQSVLSKEQFLANIKKLGRQNYTASKENIANGVFCADLHSHSLYSDGQIQISDFFEQACAYGDKLMRNFGKKFLIALSDHNCVEGVKEFLRFMAENCEKAKNIMFVPASELSFAVVCDKDSTRFRQYKVDIPHVPNIQNPEMLIYGINPFSKISEDYFRNLYKNREIITENAINKANEVQGENIFSKEEYMKYFLTKTTPFCMFNEHWQIYNYLKIKAKLYEIGKERNDKDFAAKVFEGNKEQIKSFIYNFYLFLENNGFYTNAPKIQKQLDEIMREITHAIVGKTGKNPSTENTFADLVDYAKQENAVMGFAHPLFTMQNYHPSQAFQKMQNFVRESDGTVLCAEKYHQAYPQRVTEEEKFYADAVIDRLNLINIGGRDNHSVNFSKFDEKV